MEGNRIGLGLGLLLAGVGGCGINSELLNRTSDAGKECYRSSECEGFCFFDYCVDEKCEELVGFCSCRAVPLGSCFTYLDNGGDIEALCVD